ncbi:unnamed protein product, partial [Strongylus vulgaris]
IFYRSVFIDVPYFEAGLTGNEHISCWVQLAAVFLVFFVTLAVFPAVLAGMSPNAKGEKWNSVISSRTCKVVWERPITTYHID